MKSFIYGTAVLLALIGLVFIFYDQPFFQTQENAQIPTRLETPQKNVVPTVQYPVPEIQPAVKTTTDATQEKPVEVMNPTLANPDETLQEWLTRILEEKKLLSLLNLENFIQRFVATVDSLPEKQVSLHHLPVVPPQGKFVVANGSISPDNFKRYTTYVHLVETIGITPAVSIYVRNYDLFQKAYRELGYPQGHFNDRFVAVIDHLLSTPEVKEPIGVIQPLIVYKYADSELEELSAGQKLLLRIGDVNREKVKNLLKELRMNLTSLETVN